MTKPRDFSRGQHGGDEFETSSTAIRADIERTRERLGETVEALGAQLNPSLLKQRVKDSVREATIGRVQQMASNTRDRINETSRGLAETIRENPIPAAMAVAGIGWLLMSARERPVARRAAIRRRLADEPEFADEDFEPYEARALRADVADLGANVGERAQDLSARVQETKERVVQRAQETKERVVQRAQETKEAVADRVSEARRRVGERADAAARRVRETARTTARRVEDQYDESPIGMGAVALAIGLAIGYSVPSTRREERMLGGARDRLVDRARERVADATERVEQIVERAIPDVKEAVRQAARDTTTG